AVGAGPRKWKGPATRWSPRLLLPSGPGRVDGPALARPQAERIRRRVPSTARSRGQGPSRAGRAGLALDRLLVGQPAGPREEGVGAAALLDPRREALHAGVDRDVGAEVELRDRLLHVEERAASAPHDLLGQRALAASSAQHRERI